MHFEKAAENLRWPEDHWTLLSKSSLRDKARDIFSQLSAAQRSNYDTVNEVIFKRYELVSWSYRANVMEL